MTAPHILVTGSSRGIGAAILDALSAAGARVVGQATRSGIDDDHAARLVMLAGLSGAGLGWQEAGLVVEETLRNGLVNA